MDRRTLLTAMISACVAASAVAGVTTSASAAVPRATPPKRDLDDSASAQPEVAEGEAQIHKAQYFVVRRRPRRRFFWRRPWRRRRW